jgi:hypothetical protein
VVSSTGKSNFGDPEPPWACLNNGNYTSAYITSRAVNASNYEIVYLRFYFAAYFYFPQYSYFFIRIRANETSPWKDITPWDNPPADDLVPFLYEIIIILGDGGSANALQVNWTYMSNYYLDYAVLDDVMIFSSYNLQNDSRLDIRNDRDVLLYENFSGAFPPEGWSTDWWTQCNTNNPPNAPKIDGPSSGKADVEYYYTFNATDSDDDPLMYIVDWGDNDTDWTEYGDSGVEIVLSHKWALEGDYTVKAKSVDISGAESDWSYFDIKIPKSKINLLRYSLFFWLFDYSFNLLSILQQLLAI